MMQTTQETPHFNFDANANGRMWAGRPQARFKSSWFNVIFITCRNIEMCIVNERTTPHRQTKEMSTQSADADSNNYVVVTVAVAVAAWVNCNNESRWRFSSKTKNKTEGRPDWCADGCDKNATIVNHHECITLSSLNAKFDAWVGHDDVLDRSWYSPFVWVTGIADFDNKKIGGIIREGFPPFCCASSRKGSINRK